MKIRVRVVQLLRKDRIILWQHKHDEGAFEGFQKSGKTVKVISHAAVVLNLLQVTRVVRPNRNLFDGQEQVCSRKTVLRLGQQFIAMIPEGVLEVCGTIETVRKRTESLLQAGGLFASLHSPESRWSFPRAERMTENGLVVPPAFWELVATEAEAV